MGPTPRGCSAGWRDQGPKEPRDVRNVADSMHTLADLSRTCLPRLRLALVALMLVAAPRADDVKEGEWNKKDVPKGWTLLTTPHYQIQSALDAATTKKLGEHQEAMLKLYEDFMPTRRKLETFVLKVFPDKPSYCKYSGFPPDTGAVAYYNQGNKELVGYDCGYVFGTRTTPAMLKLKPRSGNELSGAEIQQINKLLEDASNAYTFDLVRVLSHEGWHQYFHFYTVSWVPMPSWLDEGIGDYFFMAPKDMADGVLPGYDTSRINMHRLRSVRRGLEDGLVTPFETFMDYEQEQYYKNPGLNYAQGWSMVHFLLQNEDEDRRQLIPRLIKDFKDRKDFRKSTDKVFKGQDYAQLDDDWKGWLLRQDVQDPLLTLARQFGDKLLPDALDGEKRLIDVYKWYLAHPNFFPGKTGEPPRLPPDPAAPPVLSPPKPEKPEEPAAGKTEPAKP